MHAHRTDDCQLHIPPCEGAQLFQLRAHILDQPLAQIHVQVLYPTLAHLAQMSPHHGNDLSHKGPQAAHALRQGEHPLQLVHVRIQEFVEADLGVADDLHEVLPVRFVLAHHQHPHRRLFVEVEVTENVERRQQHTRHRRDVGALNLPNLGLCRQLRAVHIFVFQVQLGHVDPTAASADAASAKAHSGAAACRPRPIAPPPDGHDDVEEEALEPRVLSHLLQGFLQTLLLWQPLLAPASLAPHPSEGSLIRRIVLRHLPHDVAADTLQVHGERVLLRCVLG
mmetsp:Transcript_8505/g.17270  ORF Transcript_8505/g.17270 Transcript_8505/m.17270 type:complete len:281 (-) Transcript_8505:336-1178(-)